MGRVTPKLGCAKREEDARKTAHNYFRWSVTGWPVQAELPDTKGFEAASAHVTLETVAEHITCGPSVERHIAAVKSISTEAPGRYGAAGCVLPLGRLPGAAPAKPSWSATSTFSWSKTVFIEPVHGKSSAARGASRRPGKNDPRRVKRERWSGCQPGRLGWRVAKGFQVSRIGLWLEQHDVAVDGQWVEQHG